MGDKVVTVPTALLLLLEMLLTAPWRPLPWGSSRQQAEQARAAGGAAGAGRGRGRGCC